MNIRVRFAPSPTGKLHLGNARTAIFNWLFARAHQGKFILRIENTDIKRSRPEYANSLLEILKWLGLDWDEGPYYQSQRLDIYQEYAKKLISEGQAYYCYCSEAELEAHRQECLKKGLPPRYSGRCRHLTEAQKRQFERQGRKPAIRFKVPEDTEIVFEDLIKGPMRFHSQDFGDFIIVRSNGLPAYNFAVVIDDYLMQISHVIRGEDHLSNTACQWLLYKALGHQPPQFAHHSLILAPDHTKLSKRHGAVAVEDYRDEGLLPQAIFFYLATIGSGTQKEILMPEELIARFNLKMAGRGNAIFNKKQLLAINRQFLKRLSLKEIANHAKRFLPQASADSLLPFISLVRENVSTLKEMAEFWPVFNCTQISLSEKALNFLKKPESQEVIKQFYEALKNGQQDYEAILTEIHQKTGFKGKKLMLPLRLALTGKEYGPQLHSILEYLPFDWVILRIKSALEQANAA